MTATFLQAQTIYECMRHQSTLKNGLWLESNGYDIEFLNGYTQQVHIYRGRLRDLIVPSKVSYATICRVVQVMRACDFIIQLDTEAYVLITEPNIEQFEHFKNRTRPGWAGNYKKSGVREIMEEQVTASHRRMDDIQEQINVLSRKISEILGE